MAKRLRCYVRSHHWVEKVQAGLTYYECRHCGKYRDPTQTGLPILWFWDRKPASSLRGLARARIGLGQTSRTPRLWRIAGR
jgi:hypothetical protein